MKWETWSVNDDWEAETKHSFEGVDVWVHDTSREAYDFSQGNGKNGDILFIPSEGVVGIVATWPIAVTNEFGALHHPADWSTIRDDDGYFKGYEVDPAINFALKYGYDVPLEARK